MSEELGRREPDEPAGGGAGLAHPGIGLLGRGEHARAFLVVGLPHVRGLHAACGAVQQPHPQPLLKPGDALAQR